MIFKRGLLCWIPLVFILTFNMIAYGEETKDHWANDSIGRWIEEGYINGYENGGIKQNQLMTKAEFYTFVNNIFGFEKLGKIYANDVSEDKWYYKEIQKAHVAGYLMYFEGYKVRPDENITREEVITILAQLFGFNDYEEDYLSDFEDRDKISKWSEKSVNELVAREYVKGYTDKTIRPKLPMTRGEIFTLLDNMVTHIYDSPGTFEYPNKKIIKGNVLVCSENISINNLAVEGNIYLTKGIDDGNVTLLNTIATESINIECEGDNINIINAYCKKLYLKSNAKVTVKEDEILSKIPKLVASADDQTVLSIVKRDFDSIDSWELATIILSEVGADGEKHGVEEIHAGKAMLLQSKATGEIRQLFSGQMSDISSSGILSPVRPLSSQILNSFREIAPANIRQEQEIMQQRREEDEQQEEQQDEQQSESEGEQPYENEGQPELGDRTESEQQSSEGSMSSILPPDIKPSSENVPENIRQEQEIMQNREGDRAEIEEPLEPGDQEQSESEDGTESEEQSFEENGDSRPTLILENTSVDSVTVISSDNISDSQNPNRFQIIARNSEIKDVILQSTATALLDSSMVNRVTVTNTATGAEVIMSESNVEEINMNSEGYFAAVNNSETGTLTLNADVVVETDKGSVTHELQINVNARGSNIRAEGEVNTVNNLAVEVIINGKNAEVGIDIPVDNDYENTELLIESRIKEVISSILGDIESQDSDIFSQDINNEREQNDDNSSSSGGSNNENDSGENSEDDINIVLSWAREPITNVTVEKGEEIDLFFTVFTNSDVEDRNITIVLEWKKENDYLKEGDITVIHDNVLNSKLSDGIHIIRVSLTKDQLKEVNIKPRFEKAGLYQMSIYAQEIN
ncbi:MAG: S-layer homology domain-containing protein [Marinisporobacter sp.]|jgi:hypothetical protein|nr:S-layer homology domain-containing protein [Marinisporobacter sp.]